MSQAQWRWRGNIWQVKCWIRFADYPYRVNKCELFDKAYKRKKKDVLNIPGAKSNSCLWNLLNWCISDYAFHTMDLLWEKFQSILPLYMKPINFQSKASVVCPVTAAIFIDFCLRQLNAFSQHIGQKAKAYLKSAEQIPRNWNADQLSVLITSWDIT